MIWLFCFIMLILKVAGDNDFSWGWIWIPFVIGIILWVIQEANDDTWR